jgi:hypothetical protein
MANAIAAEGGFSDVTWLDGPGAAEVEDELGGVGTSLDWPAVVGGVDGAGLGVAGPVEGGLVCGDASAVCFSWSIGGGFSGAGGV